MQLIWRCFLGPATAATRDQVDRALGSRTSRRRRTRRHVAGMQIQSDHVGRFRLEVGIAGSHVAVPPMRLQARPLPRRGDERVRNLQRLRELARAPMGRAVRWGLSRPRENAWFHPRPQHASLRPAMTAAQAVNPVREASVLPRRRRARTPAETLRQHAVRRAVCQPQNGLGPRREIGAILSCASHTLECLAVGGGQLNMGRRDALSYHLQITRAIH